MPQTKPLSDFAPQLFKRLPELRPMRLYFSPYGFNKICVWKLQVGTTLSRNKYHIAESVANNICVGHWVKWFEKQECSLEVKPNNYESASEVEITMDNPLFHLEGETQMYLVKRFTAPTLAQALAMAINAVLDQRESSD